MGGAQRAGVVEVVGSLPGGRLGWGRTSLHFRAGCRDARVDVLIGWEVWVVRQRRACGGRAGPLHGGGGGLSGRCTALHSVAEFREARGGKLWRSGYLWRCARCGKLGREGAFVRRDGGLPAFAPRCKSLHGVPGSTGDGGLIRWVVVAVCARREVGEGRGFRAAGRWSLGRGCTSLQALQGSGEHRGMDGEAAVGVGF